MADGMNNQASESQWLDLRHGRGIFLLLFTLFFILVFVSLGFWQLSRAQEKRIILSAHDQQGAIPALRQLASPIKNHQRVTLHGNFLQTKPIFLDNKMHQHRPGYEVLRPFQLSSNSKIYLVDQGWIGIKSRKALPSTSIHFAKTQIQGRIWLPDGNPIVFRNSQMEVMPGGMRIQQVDLPALSKQLDLPLQPQVIRLQSGQDDQFVQAWPVINMTPAKHVGYSAQWFLMAIALLICYLVFYIKYVRNAHG